MSNIDCTILRSYTPRCTFGQVYYHDRLMWVSLERPWMDNKKGLSCIPEGVYQVVFDRMQSKGEDRFQILNVKDRTGIFIHPANSVAEIQGCIAMGYIMDVKSGTIGNSKVATQAFQDLMPKSFTMEIRGVR